MKNQNAFTLAELVVVLAVLALLLLLASFLLPSHGCRELAPHVQCAANLAGLGKAIAVYQADFKESNPVVFGPENKGSFGMGLYNEPYKNNNTRWVDPDFKDWDSQPTVGGCLFLLVKYVDVTPEVFLCPMVKETIELTLDTANMACKEKGLPSPKSWMDVNDFQSLANLSYSYNDPWKALMNSASPPTAVMMADKNPAYTTVTGVPNPQSGDSPLHTSKGGWDDDKRRNPRAGNSPNHNYEVQNVLFTDTHVKKCNTPTVGIDKDNIYTYWPDGENTANEKKPFGRWDKNHAAAVSDSYLGN